jgi:hypothetical protein
METRTDSPETIFVSIQLNSNRPEQIRAFLESVESTASVPSSVEVLVHLDDGDNAMELVLNEEAPRRKIKLRHLKTNTVAGFFDLWKPLNLLIKLTDPNAYFVFNSSDEFRFETKGWDDVLRKYIGYYSDNIFRIRASRLRYRNYLDFWECGFAPDSLSFYTKKWLDIVGDWNPCMGPDSFQQCIAYYLHSADPFNIDQDNRDIPEPFLRFSGEGAGLGLAGEAHKARVYGHVKAWFILMSFPMQQEAKRRAMYLKAHIWAEKNGLRNCEFRDDMARHCITITGPALLEPRHFSYRLSRTRLIWQNNIRKLQYHRYAGGGNETAYSGLLQGTLFYLSYKSKFIERAIEFFRSIRLMKMVEDRILWKRLTLLDSLLSEIGNYYIYGTGEYALRLYGYIHKRNLRDPECFIESKSIMDQRKGAPTLRGIPVASDAAFLQRLTENDCILIGSLTYRYDIIERLKKNACKAKIINLNP